MNIFFVAKQCYFQFIYLNIFIDMHDFTFLLQVVYIEKDL